MLSAAGTYALSDNVETTGMLVIAAPAGERITLDFAGHKVTVDTRDGNAYAGIDVGPSIGEVVIKDSAYTDGVPKANLVVEGNKVEDALCGIQANYAAQQGDAPAPKLTVSGVGIDVNLNTVASSKSDKAHDAFGVYVGFADASDSRGKVDALFENVSVAVSLNKFDLSEQEIAELRANDMVPLSDEATGIAYGIYTTTETVGLVGVLATSLTSSNNTCDLYSVKDASFRFDRTIEPKNKMRVYAAGNAEGSVFATIADDFEVVSTFFSNFENAADSDCVLHSDNQRLVFTKNTLDTEEGEDASLLSEPSSTPVSDAQSEPAASITISKSSVEAWGSGREDLEVTYSGSADALSATSSNESAVRASVGALSDGRAVLTLTYAGIGQATVAVTDGEASAELPVTVNATWTVGGAGYLTSAQAVQAITSAEGATMVLQCDLPGSIVQVNKNAKGPVTIDLAGHELGEVKVLGAATVPVTIASSDPGARGRLTGAKDGNVVYGIRNMSSQAVEATGVDVLVAGDSGALMGTQAVLSSGAGAVTLRSAKVTAHAPGTNQAVACYGALGSVVLDGGSVEATAADGLAVVGVANNAGGTLSAANATISATAAGSGAATAALAAPGPEGGAGLSLTGCTLTASAAEGKAAGVAQGASGGTAALSGCTASASGAQGSYALDGTAAIAPFAELSGATSLSGVTASAALGAAGQLSIGEGFSAEPGSVTVLCAAALEGGVFAAAAEGVAAAAAAPAFAPAASDENYAGMAAVADGQHLKWAAAQPAASITISKSSVEAWGSGREDLEVTYSGSADALSATSSNESAVRASVGALSDGRAVLTLTYAGIGQATVAVTDGEASAELPVTVNATWTVGGAGYLTSAQAVQAITSAEGATMVLQCDLPGSIVQVNKNAKGPVTIDLAGHELGEVKVLGAATVPVTIASSDPGARGRLTGAKDGNVVYGIRNMSSQAVEATGVDVLVAGDSGALMGTQAVLSSGAGAVTLRSAKVTAHAPGTNQAVACYGALGSVVLDGGSVEATAADGLAVVGVANNAGGTLSAANATISATAAGSGAATAALAAPGPEGGAGLSLTGCTLTASAAEGKAAGVAQGASGGTAALSGCTASASGAQGSYALDGTAAIAPFAELSGATSLSGVTASAALGAAGQLSIGEGFSAEPGSVTVLCAAALEGGVFAAAAEGVAAAAAAPAFAPAASDENYAGMAAVADGQHLKWAAAQGDKTVIPLPASNEGLVYSGKQQVGVSDGDGYTVSANGSATNAGSYAATVSLIDKENTTWPDGGIDDKEVSWAIAKATLTATYAGEQIEHNATPRLDVMVEGFVNGETPEIAGGYTAPTVTAPETIEPGETYQLEPSGGKADNYDFSYVAGNLIVAADPNEGKVSITIHSNYPDTSIDEKTVVLYGEPGSTIRFNEIETFEYQYWNYNRTYFLSGEPQTENRSYRATGTWVFPDEPIDLYVNWQHNTSTIIFKTYQNGKSTNVTYSGYAGDKILDGSGSEVVAAPDFGYRTGYRFTGWQINNEPWNEDEFDWRFPDSTRTTINSAWVVDKTQTPTVDAESADLYELLTEDGVAVNRDVVLDKQGSYYLSKSVEGFNWSLRISVPGDYSIDLRGNTIEFAGNSSSLVVGTGDNQQYEESSVSLSIMGGADDAKGNLVFGNAGSILVQGDASLSMTDIAVSRELKDLEQKGCALLELTSGYTVSNESDYPASQALTLDSCEFEQDLTMSTFAGSTNHAQSGLTSCISITSPNLATATIKDCKVSIHTGTPPQAEGSSRNVLDAVGIYVCSRAEDFSITGTTISAVADEGSAIALYRFHSAYYPSGKGVALGDGNAFAAQAGGSGNNLSVGVFNTIETYASNDETTTGEYGASAYLNGSTAFVVSGGTIGNYALASDASVQAADNAPFAMGPGFVTDDVLPVVSDLAFDTSGFGVNLHGVKCNMPVRVVATANEAGAYIVRWDGAEETAKTAFLENASNAVVGSPTFIAENDAGSFFSQDEADAEAYVIRDGQRVLSGSFENVAKQAASGDTITVNKDLTRIVEFPSVNGESEPGTNYVVDLNGHNIMKLNISSNADIAITDTTEAPGAISLVGAMSASGAIVQNGTGTLTIGGISVSSVGDSSWAYGIVVNKGTLVLDDGATVLASSPSDNAVGIVANGGETQILKGSVSAECTDASSEARGIAVGRGSVVVGPEGGVTASGANVAYGVKASGGQTLVSGMVSANALASDTRLYGLNLIGDATAMLDGADVSLVPAGEPGAQSTADAWNVYSENAAVTLSGTCSFGHFGGDAATHIFHTGTPLLVDPSFSLDEGSPQAVIVQSNNLGENDVFAQATGEGTPIEDKAGLFKSAATPSNAYAGYEAAAVEGGLAWRVPEGSVAKIGERGYPSVQAALNNAKAGDTIVLLEDFESQPLVSSKSVGLDLSGHSLTIRSTNSLSDTPTAVSVTAGRLTIVDTGDEAGQLVLALDNATVPAEAVSVSGLAVLSNGALTLDGCTVKAYVGGTAIVPELTGISSASTGCDDADAVIELRNGAKLLVGSNGANAGVIGDSSSTLLGGARAVTGISVSGSAIGDSVSVQAGCAVSAKTTMSSESAGTIIRDASGGWNLGTAENELNGARVREFDPSEDAELYEAIVKRFKQVAKYDESTTNGVYGAHIYYASPMEITEGEYAGTYVWAFSKNVDGHVGEDEYIVPDVIFIQSTYQGSEARATGIHLERGATGNIAVSGNVSATSALGRAFDIWVHKGSSASVSVNAGASLSADTGGTVYHRLTDSSPNLNELLELGNPDVSFYGKNSHVKNVVLENVVAAAIAEDNQGYAGAAQYSVLLSGDVSYTAQGEHSAELMLAEFAVADDFQSGSLRVLDPSGKNSEGTRFARSADGSPISVGQRDVFCDANGTLLPVVKDEGTILAWGGQYTIEFKDSYGAVVTRRAAGDGYLVELPLESLAEKPDSGTTSYTLVGWSDNPAAKPGDEGIIGLGAPFAFDASSFDVDDSGTLTLYPVYEESARQVTYTFAGARDEEGRVQASVEISVDAGAGMGEEALGQVPTPSDYGTCKFIGWETAIDKKGGKRTVDPDSLGNVTAEENKSFFAKYVDVASEQQLVCFKVDDYVYGYAANGGSTPTFRQAAEHTTGVSDESVVAAPTKMETGVSWSFVGYNAGHVDYSGGYAETVDYASGAALPAAVAGSETAWYTAVFENDGASKPSVKLYYYANWGVAGADDWKVLEQDDSQGRNVKRVTYGTNLNDLEVGVDGVTVDEGLKGVVMLNYAEKDSQGRWHAHKYLGWSTRKTDKQAMADLPLVGEDERSGMTSSESSYYAIYTDEEMELGLTFVIGGDSLVVKVPAGATLEEALAALAEAPQEGVSGTVVDGRFVPEAPEGKKFSGWATSEDGDVLSNGTYRLANSDAFNAPEPGDGRSEASMSLYTVFVDADLELCNVTLESGGADNWSQSAAEIGNVQEGSVIPLPDGYQAPYKNGKAFTGWNTKADGSGNSFDISKDAVSGTGLELFAQYEDLQVRETPDGTSVDASLAHVSKSGSLGVDEGGMALSLAKASKADDAIALGQRDVAIGRYSLKLIATRDGEKTDVTDQLEGSVKVTLPVPDEYAGKDLLVFVKTPDGESKAYTPTVEAATSSQDQAGSQGSSGTTAVVDIPAIGSSSVGNIVLAYRMTQEERNLELAKIIALEQLEEIFEGYSKGDYSADNWEALEQAMTSGQSAINKATTVEEVKSTAQAASDAMAAIPVQAGIDKAKAEGLERLANSFAGYDKTAYSDETWKALKDAYDKAKKAVNDAQSASEANKAASDGILAMASLEPDASGNSGSGSGSSGNGGNGSSGNGSGSNTGNGSSSGSGSTSSGTATGSRLTSSTSGGLVSSSGGTNLSSGSGLSNSSGGGLNSSTGDSLVSRLGGKITTVNDAVASENGLKVAEGAFLESVDEGGPLDKAGIEEGDVIVAVDGEKVASREDLEKLLAGKKAGDKVEVTVDRNGKRVTYTVQLGEDTSSAGSGAREGSSTLGGKQGQGVDVDGNPLTDGLAESAEASGWFLPACIVGLVLLAGIAALVWWLMRRRNGGDDSDDDFWEEVTDTA